MNAQLPLWDESSVNRWPKNSPESKGGQFAPMAASSTAWIARAAARMGRGRRRQVVEAEVWRDQAGQPHIAHPQDKRREEILAMARAAAATDTQTGPRLRWGSEGTAGWWYTPDGPSHWVRRRDTPQMIGDWWYDPRHYLPLVPPREHWNGRTFHGIPRQTPVAQALPHDVWLAGQYDIFDRDPGEENPRGEDWSRRMRRLGLRDELPSVRGRRVVRVQRAGRRGGRR